MFKLNIGQFLPAFLLYAWTMLNVLFGNYLTVISISFSLLCADEVNYFSLFHYLLFHYFYYFIIMLWLGKLSCSWGISRWFPVFLSCVYSCVCPCLCVGMHAFTYMCMCTWRLEVNAMYSLVTLHLIFLRQGLSLHPELSNSGRLAGPQAPRFPCLCLSSMGIISMGHCVQIFLHQFWGIGFKSSCLCSKH